MAQGERHHGLGAGLDDAKRRAGKLGQRRQAAGGHRQRVVGGIGQCAAAVVLQRGRQHDLEARVLGQRRGKAHFVQRRAAFANIGLGQEGGALFGLQAHGQGLRARHRRVEAQTQRAQGQAGRLGVFALAAELGQEARPHLPFEALGAFADDTRVACRGDARAPDQAHACAGREGALAGQHERGRCRLHPATAAELAQQGLAQRAFDDLHRDALEQALGFAPGRLAHAGRVDGTVQAQQEMLVFLDARARRGLHLGHDGRAGGKAAVDQAFQRAAQRLELRVRPQGAAQARGQGIRQVVDPTALIQPTPIAGRRRALAVQRVGRGGQHITGCDDRIAEAHQQLPHLGHFALRRDALHARGLCRRRRQGQRQGQRQGRHPCAPHRPQRGPKSLAHAPTPPMCLLRPLLTGGQAATMPSRRTY